MTHRTHPFLIVLTLSMLVAAPASAQELPPTPPTPNEDATCRTIASDTVCDAIANARASAHDSAASAEAEANAAAEAGDAAARTASRDALLAPPVRVWTSLNQGSGSGLDADTLDGIDSADLLAANAALAARTMELEARVAALEDRVVYHARVASAQHIPYLKQTVFPFNDVTVDTHDAADNGAFVAPRDGLYDLSAVAYFSSMVGGSRANLNLLVNGDATGGYARYEWPGGSRAGGHTFSIPGIVVELQEGDRVEARMFHSSATTHTQVNQFHSHLSVRSL